MSRPALFFAVAIVSIVVLFRQALPAQYAGISRALSWSGPNAADHARDRLPAINAALAATEPGFIFFAGDSHAALMGSAPLCGRPVVNGGVGGANALAYSELSRGLAFRALPAASVLVIGTNDLPAKNRPSEPANLARRVAQAETIVNILAARSPRLVMTAIPPVGARVAHKFDQGALITLGARLRQLCGRVRGCTFVDLFGDARADAAGIARPGALADDLHLADYGEARRKVEAILCPAGLPIAEQRP